MKIENCKLWRASPHFRPTNFKIRDDLGAVRETVLARGRFCGRKRNKMLDNLTVETGSLYLPTRKPEWLAEMAIHSGLVRAYDVDQQRKAQIVQRLRAPASASPAPSTPETDKLAVLPRRRKQNAEPKPLVHDQLMQEYAVLTRRQKERRMAIRKVEKRILTARPTSYAQAVLLLEFLSRLVATRRRFNKREVAAVMRECAVTLARSMSKPDMRHAATA